MQPYLEQDRWMIKNTSEIEPKGKYLLFVQDAFGGRTATWVDQWAIVPQSVVIFYRAKESDRKAIIGSKETPPQGEPVCMIPLNAGVVWGVMLAEYMNQITVAEWEKFQLLEGKAWDDYLKATYGDDLTAKRVSHPGYGTIALTMTDEEKKAAKEKEKAGGEETHFGRYA